MGVWLFLYLAMSLLTGVNEGDLSTRHAQRREMNDVAAAIGGVPPKRWQAATYKGLTVGRSKRADMLRILGKPKRADIPGGQKRTDPHQQVWYIYEEFGEIPGELTVIIDKRSSKILEIYLSPPNLTKEQAIKHFGSDYVMTNYKFCPGFEDEDAAPIYESSNGPLPTVEYRARGIAFHVNQAEKVDQILYLSEPLGFSSQNECQSKHLKTKRQH